MMVTQLLDEHPDPTDDQIKHYLTGNLCRCATYPEVIDAVKLAAKKRKAGRRPLDPGSILRLPEIDRVQNRRDPERLGAGMSAEPMQVETDVLVIGSGAAGMYAAIEAARAGCRVLLIDRSLIGRGGATVMAQMTVAVALGAEAPDHWSHHLPGHADRRPRAVQRAAVAAALRGRPGLHPGDGRLGRRLGAQGRQDHRGVRARPRPAALRLCRFPQHRPRRVEDAAHRRAQDRRHHPQGRSLRGRSAQGRRRGRRRGRLARRAAARRW